MKLSEELIWRGFIGQHTFDDLSEIDRGDKIFYWGVDPSSDSMTIGNLAAAILSLHFLRAGHKGILLAGGATGMAGGDPDGKDETRAKIDLETIEKNIAGIKSQFQSIFHGEKFELVNNYDWFREVKYIDFLRDIGWHFSMTQLLDRDFVQNRIGEGGKGINYAEFSYSLIQGYDFLHLFREKGATLQLCAVDQFGNSVSGMQMIRKIEGARADVFGMPLVINKSTGKKFGKSEDGAIWLSAEKTSPYQFYQFWLNVDDAGVIDYLKIYTFLSSEEINALAENHFENPGERAAQRTLAHEVTELVHGRDTVASVERVTRVLFGSADFNDLTDEDLDALAKEIPTVNLREDLTIVDALTESEIASSNSEASRLIKQNAISVSGAKIDADQQIKEKSLIKKGKNQFILVK
ncbi:tyrosine--tRNA ligase [Candidatus Saccharibacteria bacterium]|nr:tyrosine--tRNA ligase [Candidatus Saccharibacteria bacterium]